MSHLIVPALVAVAPSSRLEIRRAWTRVQKKCMVDDTVYLTMNSSTELILQKGNT